MGRNKFELMGHTLKLFWVKIANGPNWVIRPTKNGSDLGLIGPKHIKVFGL